MTTITRSNIGSTDRAFRAFLGVALLALAFTGPRTAWGYLGFIPLLTAAIGYCPLYSLLGFSTRKAP
jgi:hypothetical protein